MRTGKDLILATREFAHENVLYSWWSVISTALLLMLAMLGAALLNPWPLQLTCSILAGLLGVRFFVIYHDHQHNSLLPNSRLIAGMMRLWGILSMTPNDIWTHSHNSHHRHNSKLRYTHVGSFPVMTTTRYINASRMERVLYRFNRSPVTIACGYLTAFIFAMCILPFFENHKNQRDCALALVIHVAVYVILWLTMGPAVVFFAWFLPNFIAAGLGVYLFYAQHNFPTVTYKEKDGWTYETAALESSSFCKMGPIMNYFTANIGFHHIHHLNAKIPFYRLPEVFRKMPELQHPKVTSLNPLEMLRCLRLFVWDCDQQRMINRKELKLRMS